MNVFDPLQFFLVQLAAGLFGAVLGVSISIDLVHHLIPGVP